MRPTRDDTDGGPGARGAHGAHGAEDPWRVDVSDFPGARIPEEAWRFFLRYAVLAPSTRNVQPWLFEARGDRLSIYADRSRALPVVDPDDRELVMSCGAALLHLRIALRRFGYSDRAEILPDPSDSDLLAQVRLVPGEPASSKDRMLLDAIPRRHTNRSAFEDRPIPRAVLDALRATASEEGAWFRVVEGEVPRRTVTDLVTSADRAQWAQKAFRREYAAWMRSNRSDRHDGIPGYAHGVGDLMSHAGPLVTRTFDLGEGRAAKDGELARGSPVLACVGTYGDEPRDWIAAGQGLARTLLRARADEIWASFLDQPIEVTELRPQLLAALDTEGFPQALLRMGYGPEVKPTPRRSVDEVLRLP